MPNATRRQAEEKFGQLKPKQEVALSERDRAQQELAEKTARLRALRLAKEAADREAAEQAPAGKPTGRRTAAPRRRKP